MGRIRQAEKAELPTTGHLLSHSVEEICEELVDKDTDHILMLDDTSFSGSTSVIIESLVRQAFPERTIDITHGFLILNEGMLGESIGAKQRLACLGSRAVGGMRMHTPRDDGWHFFDMVGRGDGNSHLRATVDRIKLPHTLLDEDRLRILFPELVTHDELVASHKMGRFITSGIINGGFHVRNPQLLPNVVGQGHLLPPHEWRAGEEATLEHLIHINQLLRGEVNA